MPRYSTDVATAETLSVPDAARQLGVAAHTAYAAARRGELPIVKIGRRVRVLRRPFERLLDGELDPRPREVREAPHSP